MQSETCSKQTKPLDGSLDNKSDSMLSCQYPLPQGQMMKSASALTINDLIDSMGVTCFSDLPSLQIEDHHASLRIGLLHHHVLADAIESVLQVIQGNKVGVSPQ